MASSTRVDLDGNPIELMTIYMIGASGFIGSHLCEKLMEETPHKILALDAYNDKIKHLLEPDTHLRASHIQFHRLNIKHDSRLKDLIKMAEDRNGSHSSDICTENGQSRQAIEMTTTRGTIFSGSCTA